MQPMPCYWTATTTIATAGTGSTSVSLRIHPSWLSVEPGDPAQLECRLTCNNASVCNPLPTLRWQSEYGYFNPQATIDDGLLTIPSTASRDQQYYTCTAVSQLVSLSVRTVIVVEDKCEYTPLVAANLLPAVKLSRCPKFARKV